MFVQEAVMGYFVAAPQNYIDRSRITFYTPRRDKERLADAKLAVRFNDTRYRHAGPVLQHGDR